MSSRNTPSSDPAFRRAQYAAKLALREAAGTACRGKRGYKKRPEPEDHMPLAKARAAIDPFRGWAISPDYWK